MAMRKNHKALIKKLKKQVRMLQRKSNQNRNKLQTVLKKLRKQARGYKSKLARKVRMMKAKMVAVQSSTYAKAASSLEKQMMKSLDRKSKAFASALAKIDKKH